MKPIKVPAIILSIIMFFSSTAYALGNENNQSVESAVLQDIAGHWAEDAIRHAVTKGYVSGYPDDTFQPNKSVTRAEFITMLVKALEIGHSSSGTPWYEPYVIAAIDQHIHDESDFTDYVGPLTRLEMVRLAIRAIDGNKDDNQAYLIAGAESGILQGIGDGALAPTGTSTRAQAVAIIERILTVQAGGKLPVDEKAVTAAQNIQLDPWGRVIRTTNLPKNAEEFPYILEEIPNEMYELEFRYVRNDKMTTVELMEFPQYNTEVASRRAEIVEQWGTQIFNVDYKTIDENWAELYAESMLVQSTLVENNVEKYMRRVKENKIQIEGMIKPEPSIMVYGDGKLFIRAYYKFRIIHNNKKVNPFLVGISSDFLDELQSGVWYEGCVDVPLVTNIDDGTWNHLKVSTTTNLSRYGVHRRLE